VTLDEAPAVQAAANCEAQLTHSDFAPLGPKAGAAPNVENPAPPSDVVPGPAEHPIDLVAALAQAGVDNPTIALAQEAVRASQAELLQARALLLPTLDAGVSFNLHRGNLLSAQGIVVNVNRQSLYAGAGAEAVGAGTVGIPGVRLTAHVADAVFDPRAARQRVASRQADAAATQNNVLLDVTTRYFDLTGAELRLQALRQSERDLAEVARLTANFARTGQGREGDAERARSALLLLQARDVRAQEEVEVAAAELARLLSLDPAVRLRAPAGDLAPLRLVGPDLDLEQLVQLALRKRPELAARAAEIMELQTRLRKECVRPLLPFLTVGFSGGEFGGGSDQADVRFGHFSGRTDFDALAVWSLQNLGFGNRAMQRQLRAQVGEAMARREEVLDLVRREVAEAYALSAERLRVVDLARRRVATAQQAFREDLQRSQNLEARPIEVLTSVDLLTTARLDFVQALVGYNQAQFQLFVALGQPPTLALPAAGACP
jgi:outer membrane protein TolC